uniref:Uncharacterized protein n=1 Tax=Glossina pallidipes TaxID=7398 RepID=A0A1A9Z2F6_GLOPL
MRIIHVSGYSDKDKRGCIKLVAENIFLAMQSMIKARDLLRIFYGKEEYSELATFITSVGYETVTTFEVAYLSGIKTFWVDTVQDHSVQNFSISFTMGVSTMRKIIYETCEFVWDNLAAASICLPNGREWKKIAQSFNNMRDIPYSISATDRNHIAAIVHSPNLDPAFIIKVIVALRWRD